MTAAEVADASGIPEEVIVEKFGLRGKHIAAATSTSATSPCAAARDAARRAAASIPESIDVVMYYGSMWKDYAVWQAAPWIAHRLGCANAYAVEYDNVSCGDAGRAARSRATCCSPSRRAPQRARSSPPAASRTCSTTRTSARASCSTSATARSPGCSSGRRPERAARLHALTDGSFSLQVKVPVGGSVVAERRLPLPRRRRPGRDEGAARRGRASPNFVAAAEGALERSGATLADVGYLCGHPHEALDARRARRRARRRRRRARPTSTTRAT